MYFIDKNAKLLRVPTVPSTVKIIHYCQIFAKLVFKFSVAAILEKLLLNLKIIAKLLI